MRGGRFLAWILAAAPLAAGATDDVNVLQMKLGECYADTAIGDDTADAIETVRRVDCARPHLQQVYHVENLPGDRFPGSKAVDDAADAICEAHFDAFVGLAYDESEFLWTHLAPNKDGWYRHKDREVVCLVMLPDNGVWTGSAKDSRR